MCASHENPCMLQLVCKDTNPKHTIGDMVEGEHHQNIKWMNKKKKKPNQPTTISNKQTNIKHIDQPYLSCSHESKISLMDIIYFIKSNIIIISLILSQTYS